MGTNCTSICQDNNPNFLLQSLALKQFSPEEIQTFVNNIEPFFQQGSQKDVANLRDLDNFGFSSLVIDQKLKSLLEELKIELDEHPKLWRLNRNLAELSHEYGPAYLWNCTLSQNKEQKQKSSEEKREEKLSLLNSKIKILISNKDQPKNIIAYFSGNLVKGYAQGSEAVFISNQGVIYQGCLTNSSANGLGKFQNRKIGYSYVGIWFQDYPHSIYDQAKEKILIDSSKEEEGYEEYTGQFKYGKREGNGHLISPCSENHPQFEYNGEFKDGKFHGEGKLQIFTEKGKNTYIGEFKDGKQDGQGTSQGNQQFYKGQWKNGEKNGKGEFLYKKSDIKYIGKFRDDNFNGEGKLYKKGEEIANGLWVNGKCILKI